MIRAGERRFESSSVALVKVVHDGHEELLELRIRPYDVNAPELLEVRNARPRPSVRREMVRPSDPLGRDLGLTRPEAVTVHDAASADFEEALRRWNERLFAVSIKLGLAERVEEADGREVTDPERLVQVLQENGLTRQQLASLSEQISGLTRLTEDEIARYFRDRNGSAARGDRGPESPVGSAV